MLEKDLSLQVGSLFRETLRYVWDYLGWVLILSGLGFLASLPVLTFGPALAAVVYFTFLIVDREPVVLQDLWEAFRRFFWRGVILGLLVLGVWSILIWDMYFFFRGPWPFLRYLSPIIAYFMIIWSMVSLYIFPLLVRQDVGIKKVLSRAFRLAMVAPGFNFGAGLLWAVVTLICIPIFPALFLLWMAGYGFFSNLAFDRAFNRVEEILAKKEE